MVYFMLAIMNQQDVQMVCMLIGGLIVTDLLDRYSGQQGIDALIN
jgi:hypothetical protein